MNDYQFRDYQFEQLPKYPDQIKIKVSSDGETTKWMYISQDEFNQMMNVLLDYRMAEAK